jgi:hypothetical protein
MTKTKRRGFYHNSVSQRYEHVKERMLAFQHYGDYKCACCGEQEFAFLTLDHINGDGNASRLELFGKKSIAGHHMYRKLRKQGFPAGYQVLCMNCQVGRRDNGGLCPHKSPCATPDELVEAFGHLRVGKGNHAETLTEEYKAALKCVSRRTAPHLKQADDFSAST